MVKRRNPKRRFARLLPALISLLVVAVAGTGIYIAVRDQPSTASSGFVVVLDGENQVSVRDLHGQLIRTLGIAEQEKRMGDLVALQRRSTTGGVMWVVVDPRNGDEIPVPDIADVIETSTTASAAGVSQTVVVDNATRDVRVVNGQLMPFAEQWFYSATADDTGGWKYRLYHTGKLRDPFEFDGGPTAVSPDDQRIAVAPYDDPDAANPEPGTSIEIHHLGDDFATIVTELHPGCEVGGVSWAGAAVVALCSNGTDVVALDPDTGKSLWSESLPEGFSWSPSGRSPDGGLLYTSSNGDPRSYVSVSADGIVGADFAAQDPVLPIVANADGDVLYLTHSATADEIPNPLLQLRDVDDKNTLWTWTPPMSASDFIVEGQLDLSFEKHMVLVNVSGSRSYVVDIVDGTAQQIGPNEGHTSCDLHPDRESLMCITTGAHENGTATISFGSIDDPTNLQQFEMDDVTEALWVNW